MKLKNILIVVNDIEKSKKFYHDLFGLDMVLDNNGNMILTEGLVLQDKKIWKDFLNTDIIPNNNSCELYFEERDIESFVQKLETLYPSIQYVHPIITHSWGQKVIRFYDLDGNLIEVGTPMNMEEHKTIEDKQILLHNINKIHTTEMGIERIKRNLNINVNDVVEYCINKIIQTNCIIYKQGKNYYCEVDNMKITINAHSYTIITAHMIKNKNSH